MENNTIIITECEAITLVNNFKKFYHAFRKINNLKIEKTIILDFLNNLLKLKSDFNTHNEFKVFPRNFKKQFIEKCKGNEMEIMKIYEKYFKEHIGHRFIFFLKTNGVLDKYKDNLNKQMDETLLCRILFATPESYVDSFIWSQTKQGFEYLSSLDKKRCDILNNEAKITKFTQEYYKQILKIFDEYNIRQINYSLSNQ